MKAIGWTTKEAFDYSNVTTEAPAPPEEGLYRAKITLAVPQASKEGKPMARFTVELFENGKGEALNPKRKVTDNMVLTQAALFRVLMLAQALDIEPLADSSLESTESFCREVVTASRTGVWVKIKHEPYTDKNGNERISARVDRYLSDAKVAEEGRTETSSSSNGTATPARRPRAQTAATTTAS